MRSLARTVAALAVALATALVPAATASAAEKAPAARWAKHHHLKGAWRAKDADRDGLKNLREFKLKTDPRRADTDRDGLRDGDELTAGDDPRKADTDRDGVKDGAEHAGVITAFDGAVLTLREFRTRRLVTATLAEDADCYAGSDDSGVDDSTAADDDATGDDDDFIDDEDLTAEAAQSEDDVDLTGDDDAEAAAGCEHPRLVKGAVVRRAELEHQGAALFVVSLELVS